MTQNQIAYANYRETKRHNLAYENETKRHNVIGESQGWRDVDSRGRQATAALVNAASNSWYNSQMVPIHQQSASASTRNAAAAYMNAVTNQGQVSIKTPVVSFSGSLTGLHNGIVQPIINQITGTFTDKESAIAGSVRGKNSGTPHPKQSRPKRSTSQMANPKHHR